MRAPFSVLGVLVVLVILAPVLAPADPMQTDAAAQLQPPGQAHLLGTDLLGRDVISRALYGGRRTLVIAGIATLIAVVPGALLGVTAGTLRGSADEAVVVVLNAILAFPSLVVALAALTLMGAGWLPLATATGFSLLASFARVARSAVIGIRNMPYVEAAQSMGASRWHIMQQHILPNIETTLLAYAGVIFGYTILNSAMLSALGLGGEPGVPDWGTMLADGRTAFRAAPWIGLIPGLAITATVWAVNRIADRLGSGSL